MGGGMAPEFIFDQGLGLYYPTNTDFYGYYCMEPDPPIKWDKHCQHFDVDGQDLCTSAVQTEGFADVYYIPSYGYAQSSYNPYDPSILIGSEASFTATNYQANPAQHFFVSSPVYIPVGNESSSVAVPICYQTPSWTNTGALPISKPDGEGKKFALPLTPMNIGAASEMVALKHVVSKPLQSSSDLSQAVTKLEIESDGKNTLDTQPPIGALTSDSIPTINQGANHLSNLKAPTAFRPAKADALANTGFTSYVSDLNLCSDGNRLRPRFQMNRDFTNMSLSLAQQNRGHSDIVNCQWASPPAIKAFSSKSGNIDAYGNITIGADEYNTNDFRIDYEAAKFFVIKSYSEDDVHKSIKYNVWSSTPSGNKRLGTAFDEAQKLSEGREVCPVFLFFSFNASGRFCGVAEMIGPVDFLKDMDFWQQDKWRGSFPLKWHILKDVANTRLRHILLENNEYRPVTCSRDTQEIPFLQGNAMLHIFKSAPASTSILDDFMHYEERERILLKGKSRLPGRRCSADFIPTTSVSMERAVTIDEEKVGTAEQHTTEAAEELVESNGRGAHKMCNGRFYEAGNQQDVIVTPVGDEVDYSSSTDQDSDSSSCTPTKAVESLSRPAELIILGRSVGQLDCDGVNYIAKISSLCVDSQAGEVQSFSSKIDVITIGSMHIKLENKPALEFLL